MLVVALYCFPLGSCANMVSCQKIYNLNRLYDFSCHSDSKITNINRSVDLIFVKRLYEECT